MIKRIGFRAKRHEESAGCRNGVSISPAKEFVDASTRSARGFMRYPP
ncbi:MAG: hypothetical protein ACOVSW_13630 [Candidatus Kapaibacteriota bacterium]